MMAVTPLVTLAAVSVAAWMQGSCDDWLGDYACWNVQSLIPVSLLGKPMYVWTQVIGN